MPRPSAFAEHVAELLSPLGPVSVRPMFGGYGIYLDTTMFALIADNRLYLRTDEATRPRFEAQGLAPFKPFADRSTVMSYNEAPAALFDEPEALLIWARDAVAAARRAPRPAPRPRRRR